MENLNLNEMEAQAAPEETAVPACEEACVCAEAPACEEGCAFEETPVCEEVAAEEAAEIPVCGEGVVVEAPVQPKKSLFKKWWFWTAAGALVLAIVIGVVAIASSGSSGSSGGGSYYTPNPYVELVKTATNSNYGITYGDAFDDFFSNPKWSHFEASTGEQVVEFEGGFSYADAPATALVQFVLDLDEGTLEVYYLEINGEAQNRLMLAALLEAVFESYY